MTDLTRDGWAARRKRRADRFIVGYLSFSSVVLVVLIVIVATLVNANSQNISAQQQQNIQQCQIANVTRLQDIAIWNRLLQVPASAPAAQKAEVADLEHLVKVKDTPRDCAAAYGGR
jgi:4-alpha-glucanotransferase